MIRLKRAIVQKWLAGSPTAVVWATLPMPSIWVGLAVFKGLLLLRRMGLVGQLIHRPKALPRRQVVGVDGQRTFKI
jgi:hypothetical protein